MPRALLLRRYRRQPKHTRFNRDAAPATEKDEKGGGTARNSLLGQQNKGDCFLYGSNINGEVTVWVSNTTSDRHGEPHPQPSLYQIVPFLNCSYQNSLFRFDSLKEQSHPFPFKLVYHTGDHSFSYVQEVVHRSMSTESFPGSADVQQGSPRDSSSVRLREEPQSLHHNSRPEPPDVDHSAHSLSSNEARGSDISPSFPENECFIPHYSRIFPENLNAKSAYGRMSSPMLLVHPTNSPETETPKEEELPEDGIYRVEVKTNKMVGLIHKACQPYSTKRSYTCLSSPTEQQHKYLTSPTELQHTYLTSPTEQQHKYLTSPTDYQHTYLTSPTEQQHKYLTSPTEQQHTYLTSPTELHHTYLTSPTEQQHKYLTSPTEQQHKYLTSPTEQQHTLLTPTRESRDRCRGILTCGRNSKTFTINGEKEGISGIQRDEDSCNDIGTEEHTNSPPISHGSQTLPSDEPSAVDDLQMLLIQAEDANHLVSSQCVRKRCGSFKEKVIRKVQAFPNKQPFMSYSPLRSFLSISPETYPRNDECEHVDYCTWVGEDCKTMSEKNICTQTELCQTFPSRSCLARRESFCSESCDVAPALDETLTPITSFCQSTQVMMDNMIQNQTIQGPCPFEKYDHRSLHFKDIRMCDQHPSQLYSSISRNEGSTISSEKLEAFSPKNALSSASNCSSGLKINLSQIIPDCLPLFAPRNEAEDCNKKNSLQSQRTQMQLQISADTQTVVSKPRSTSIFHLIPSWNLHKPDNSTNLIVHSTTLNVPVVYKEDIPSNRNSTKVTIPPVSDLIYSLSTSRGQSQFMLPTSGPGAQQDSASSEIHNPLGGQTSSTKRAFSQQENRHPKSHARRQLLLKEMEEEEKRRSMLHAETPTMDTHNLDILDCAHSTEDISEQIDPISWPTDDISVQRALRSWPTELNSQPADTRSHCSTLHNFNQMLTNHAALCKHSETNTEVDNHTSNDHQLFEVVPRNVKFCKSFPTERTHAGCLSSSIMQDYALHHSSFPIVQPQEDTNVIYKIQKKTSLEPTTRTHDIPEATCIQSLPGHNTPHLSTARIHFLLDLSRVSPSSETKAESHSNQLPPSSPSSFSSSCISSTSKPMTTKSSLLTGHCNDYPTVASSFFSRLFDSLPVTNLPECYRSTSAPCSSHFSEESSSNTPPAYLEQLERVRSDLPVHNVSAQIHTGNSNKDLVQSSTACGISSPKVSLPSRRHSINTTSSEVELVPPSFQIKIIRSQVKPSCQPLDNPCPGSLQTKTKFHAKPSCPPQANPSSGSLQTQSASGCFQSDTSSGSIGSNPSSGRLCTQPSTGSPTNPIVLLERTNSAGLHEQSNSHIDLSSAEHAKTFTRNHLQALIRPSTVDNSPSSVS